MAEAALILLAAGASRRMGRPKQFLDIGGRAMLRHAAESALASRCDRVVVVGGASFAAVGELLEGLPVELLHNPDWQSGIGSSIRLGVAALAVSDARAAVVALGDQPLVTAAAYDALVSRWESIGARAVASRYAGTIGAPALFDRALFPNMLAMDAEAGCKSLLLALPPQELAWVDCEDASTDVDTPLDYARLRALVTGDRSLDCDAG